MVKTRNDQLARKCLVKKLIEKMGGAIKLESVLGVGTTFTIHIKLEKVRKATNNKNTTNDNEISDDSDSKELLGKKCPMKIIVAEDNAVNQLVLRMMLEKIGYNNCEFVGDGQELVEKVGLNLINGVPDYDVILMDMQMPKLDGVEATKIIKGKYGESSPLILALTANAFQEDKDRCAAAGMDDFLEKPISSKKLKSALLKSFSKLKK